MINVCKTKKRLNPPHAVTLGSFCCIFCSQEPQATLRVSAVRAECLLKFQLRPVMEWQRLVCPSAAPTYPPIWPTSLRSSERCLVTENNLGWSVALGRFSSSLFFFNLLSQVSALLVFFSASLLSKRSRSSPGSGVKRIPALPTSVFPGSDVCLLDSVSRSLETPSPPAARRSLWKKLLRSRTFWTKSGSAKSSASLTPKSLPVSSPQRNVFNFSTFFYYMWADGSSVMFTARSVYQF